MIEEAALQIVRFLHYFATTILFGAALFPIYALNERRYIRPPPFVRPLPWAIIALITASLWLVLSAANMANTFAAIGDLETWRAVFDMGFGRIWATRIVIGSLIVCVCFLRIAPGGSTWLSMVIAALAGLLLATLSAVGHTQVEQGVAGRLHVGMDALHLLAAGAWLGGLMGLVVTLRDPYVDQRSTILMRFSHVGILAVATLIGTGLVNSWFLVGTIDNLWTSRYGELLFVKLAAFFSMVALAAANRFWLLPAMESMLHPKSQNAKLRQLKQHVYVEFGLGTVVLLVVGILGTLQPAGAH